MSRIAAFVGHSFATSDEALVDRFLKFFTHVHKLGIGFTWDHAEYAEPKILSEKVQAKMEGKNLFIGICTFKEFAIVPEKLRTPFLWWNSMLGGRADFERKTSDWITQEIGYAIAKGMKLILLLESGVRRPGGLQGDIEHIAFDRANPSDSFQKILEMLQALGPKVVPLEQATSPAKAEPSKADEKQAKGPLEGAPNATWTLESYKDAIFDSAFNDDNNRTAELLESFGNSESGKDGEKRAVLEAHSLWIASLLGKKGAHAARLEELATSYPNSIDIKRNLAQSYERFGSHDKAAQQYLAAASLSAHVEEKLGFLNSAAQSRARNGDGAAESWLRAQYVALSGVTEECSRMFRWGLLQLAEIAKADAFWIAYQEARLIDFPDKYDARNDLAWKYFERGNLRLALYHYLLIPSSERSETVWNNIGAAYKQLGMSGKAVTAYRKSEAMGGTYAVSNLAYLLIDTGFTKEAEDLCNAALKIDGCDKRVAAAFASIDEKSSKENDKGAEEQGVAKNEHRFMAKLGNALCANVSLPKTTSWITPECDVFATVDGETFKATGAYEQPSLATIFASHLSGEKSKGTTMVVEYEGRIAGRGVSFKKLKYEKGSKPSLLSSAGETGQLIFDEALQFASVIVSNDKNAAIYQEWTRSN